MMLLVGAACTPGEITSGLPGGDAETRGAYVAVRGAAVISKHMYSPQWHEPLSVYLNPYGGTYFAGPIDDPNTNTSSAMQALGKTSVTVPAADMSNSDWREVQFATESRLSGEPASVANWKSP